jgi:branched-chain amino acid transport system substrate-binding protein
VYPTLGATDFGTQISQLGSRPAQGLFVGILGADAATFAKQAAQFGLFGKYKFIIGSGYLQAALLPALGDGVVGTHEVLNYSPEASAETPFGKVYATKGDGPLWHVPIEGHLALVLLDGAADKAGSTDPAKVAKALGGLTIEDTIVGKVTMRAEDHLLLQDLFPAVAEPGPTLSVKSTIPAADATPPVNPACKMS